MNDPEYDRIHTCQRCGEELMLKNCPECNGSGGLPDREPCWCCGGVGVEWACPVCDVDEESEEDIEPEPEPTRDELLQALREAWGDVINHRTHILHDFTDFFTNMLGEE